MDTSKSEIYFAQTWRIAALIILALPIPLTFRLLLLYTTDSFDCRVVNIFKVASCKTFFYQMNDKIIDTLTYVVVMAYFFINFKSNPLIYVLFGFLLSRIVGVVKFYQTKGDNAMMVAYPDVFREFSVYLALIYDGFIPDKLRYDVVILIILILAKVQFEKYFHKDEVIATSYI